MAQCTVTDIGNFNFSDYEFPDYPLLKESNLSWEKWVKIGFYVVMMGVALVGNFVLILTIVFKRSMRTTINCYLVNLAVADVLICSCCMWVHLVNDLNEPVYVLGEFMCKLNSFAQMTCLTSSVLTLSSIACDRFIAIIFPIQARVTKQRTGIIIGAIWVVSVGAAVPFLVYRKYFEFSWSNYVQRNCGENWPQVAEFVPELKMCLRSYPAKKIYYTFVTIALFFLPVAIMSTAYSVIVWRLWMTEMPGERNLVNLNMQQRAKRKVVKMVCVVLFVFVLCWMPLQIIVLYSQYFHSSSIHGELPGWFSGFAYFSTFIAYSNSALNPIIYGGFNTSFRQNICAILRCRFGFGNRTLRRPTMSSRQTYSTAISMRSKIVSSRTKTEMRTMNMCYPEDTKEETVIEYTQSLTPGGSSL